jgi:hypothetical protein
MKYLENFKNVGHWKLDSTRKSNKSLKILNLPGIKAEIKNSFQNLKDLVYIFKNANEIIYIGETSSALKERLNSYAYGFDKLNDTDNRVKIALTKKLLEHQCVEILIWQPSTTFNLCGELINIPISKPIEEILIKKFSSTSELINTKGAKKSHKITDDLIKSLFEIKPDKWVLRGDSYLWEDIKICLLQIKKLLSPTNFDFCIDRIFDSIILSNGEYLETDKIYFKSYPQEGISAGIVDRNWWMNIGLPLLKNRFKKNSNRKD